MFYFLLIPITYLIVALILSTTTVARVDDSGEFTKEVYLHTNGVHLDIVIPIENMDSLLLSGIQHARNENYLSFGWGDEDFYINTPTWNDLTFYNGFKAMFLQSTTLIHVTRYTARRSDWKSVKISATELKKLNAYVLNSFDASTNGSKVKLDQKGYSDSDDFYKANGSYSCFNTCNSWVNRGFKESGLKACVWTPFDFGLLNKYE